MSAREQYAISAHRSGNLRVVLGVPDKERHCIRVPLLPEKRVVLFAARVDVVKPYYFRKQLLQPQPKTAELPCKLIYL